MNVQTLSLAVLFLAATLPGRIVVAADAPPAQITPSIQPALGQNAALSYWPGFSFIPSGEANEKLLSNWKFAPLDDATKKLIDDGKTALYYLHLGASAPACNWGLKLDEGPGLLLPYLAKARDLARLACLRARLRFESGDNAGAVEDIADVLTLARHVGSDDIMIIMLVQQGIEQTAMDAAWPYLKRLDATTLRHLQDRLQLLGPGASLKRCIEVWERYSGPRWLMARVQKSVDDPAWIEKVFGPTAVPQPEVEAAIRAGGNTPQAVIEQLQKVDAFFPELAAAVDLPPQDAPKRLDEIIARMRQNPLGNLIASNIGTLYQKSAGAAAQIEAFKSDVAKAIVDQTK